MEKVIFKFSHGGRVAFIYNAGIHQKALMLEYKLYEEVGNAICYSKHPQGIKVCTNSYFEMHRFCQFIFNNTDPNDYDSTLSEFLNNTQPHLIK